MTCVSDVMTAPVVTVATAARVMTAYRVSRLPVVAEDGTLIGIVSQGDVLRALAGPD